MITISDCQVICWSDPPFRIPLLGTVISLSRKQRGPNPDKSFFVRKRCCRCIVEPLTCRWFLSYEGVILRVRVPLFASENGGFIYTCIHIGEGFIGERNLRFKLRLLDLNNKAEQQQRIERNQYVCVGGKTLNLRIKH